MELTAEVLRQKIEKVNEDIEKMRGNGNSVDQIMMLNDYVDYLKDELRMLEKANGGK